MLQGENQYPAAVKSKKLMPNSGLAVSHLFQQLGAEDVTPEQMAQSLAHLERLATLGALSAGTAHELNNPLSIVITTCQALLNHLQEGTMAAEQVTHFVGVIEENAWRCVRLVQSLQRYSRRATPQPEHAEVYDIIDDAVALVQHELRGREATLYLEMAADIPPVYWDSGQIMQALVNLLLNARDALPPQGGQVSLRAQYHPLSDEVVITVTDTGKGVPPELQEKIFEPFFTTKPAGRGTGLGLSVALGIITQHEGQITVANEPEGGATFTIVLPCRPVLDELDEIEQGVREYGRVSG